MDSQPAGTHLINPLSPMSAMASFIGSLAALSCYTHAIIFGECERKEGAAAM